MSNHQEAENNGTDHAPKPSPTPWGCHHDGDTSAIYANTDQPIAETFGVNAEANAEIIVSAVNNYARLRSLVMDMIRALDLCLESGGLTWEAEQEADIIVMRARQAIGN